MRAWPNSTMFYIVESGFPEKLEKKIRDAIETINNLNIVKLVEVIGDDYAEVGQSVFIYKNRGCSSHIGWNQDDTEESGGGLIRISQDCSTGVIIHEILHALGFIHEQVNPSSNLIFNYSRIAYNEDQFINKDAVALTTYDSKSIMHYSSNDFSICNYPDNYAWVDFLGKDLPDKSCKGSSHWTSIESGVNCPVECAVFSLPGGEIIEKQRNSLSALDILGLRSLYPLNN